MTWKELLRTFYLSEISKPTVQNTPPLVLNSKLFLRKREKGVIVKMCPLI